MKLPAFARLQWLASLAILLVVVVVALLLGPGAAHGQRAPTVSSVAVTSDAGDDDTYAKDDLIQITVTFTEPVDVTGTPQLNIDMDPAEWGTKQAAYTSGSGTANLVFTHTVTEPNISTQGIAVLANTLQLNNGTIKSTTSQTDADLTHTGLDHNPSHKVNWQQPTATAPTVSSVAVTSHAGNDDTYAKDDVIQITVTFSEPVDVTGTPRLSIDMDPADWGTKQATYDSGNGTTSLVFTHTVTEPNISTQGIAVLANTLELNNGTIKSTTTQTDAHLTHTGLAHNPNHKVNWQLSPPAANAPTVSAVAVTSDAGEDDTYAKNDVIEVTVTFSEAVDVTGTPRLSIDMDPADWGTKQATYDSGNGTTSLVFTHTVTEPNISTQGIAVLANTLELNSGTIKSTTTQTDAHLTHTGLAHNPNHKVNWRLPPTECALTAPSSVSGLGIERGAVVTWTLPEDLADTCEVTGFVVGATDDADLGREDEVTDPAARTHTLRGLDPGEYRFYVRVKYAEGMSDELETAQQNTVPADCSVTLTVEADFPLGVSGSWTYAGSGTTGCESGGVTIEFKKTSESTWNSDTELLNDEGRTQAFTMGGLEGGVSYDFRVVATDAAGGTNTSAAQTVTVGNGSDEAATFEAARLRHDKQTQETKLWIEFTEVLAGSSVPPAAFTVRATPQGGIPRTVRLATATVLEFVPLVLLELAEPVAAGEQVTVSYAKPSTNPLRTSTVYHDGSEVEGFTDMPVVNGPPKVESVALSSDPGDGNTYEPGDRVLVEVTFTDVVLTTLVVNRDRQVIASPRVRLDFDPLVWTDGRDKRWATYKGGSGTQTLTFAYTVTEADVAAQGIAVDSDGLELNGGEIKASWPGDDAQLPHAGLAHDPAHRVE